MGKKWEMKRAPNDSCQASLIFFFAGTCFTLWRDIVDHQSSYTRQDEMFHTMHLSADPLCRVSENQTLLVGGFI